jgi:OmpA-OmpF porin, OOP family
MRSSVGLAACLLSGVLTGLLPGRVLAQDWQVTRLKVGGAAAQVATVHWIASRAQPMQARELRVNDKLSEGGELRAAANVEIELTSPKGVRVIKESGDSGALRLDSSGQRGEASEVRQGRWSFVKKVAGVLGDKTDPFTARAGAAAARTEGTEFSVAVDDAACEVRFEVQEGAIQVSLPVTAEIAGVPGAAGWTQRRLLKAGEPALRLPMSPSGVNRRFGQLDDALATFRAEAGDAQTRLDTDAHIDALIALGEVLLLSGRALDALRPFERALPLAERQGAPDWLTGLRERIKSVQKAQGLRAADASRAPTKSPVSGDPGFDALEARLMALRQGRPLPGNFHLAKAQCWLDVSRHEFHRNDRSGFVRQAWTEAERLVAGMEVGDRLDNATPLLGQAQRLRPDLWSRAAALNEHAGASCAAQALACAEVRLVHAGHEFAQQQWRHGQPYLQMAEDLIARADALARSCPAPAPSTTASADRPPAPPRLPGPAEPLTAAPTTAPSLIQKLSYSADAFFDSGLARLKPEGRARLLDLADKTRGIELETVVIVGHTDSHGSEVTNLRLSLLRAAAVKTFLTQQGLPAERFFIEGKGGRSPVADNRSTEGRAANRRVEVEVIGSRRTP